MAKSTVKDKGTGAVTNSRGRKRRDPEDGPNPVDAHVGGRVRLRRTLLGLSQTTLAEAIGLTFQQVQKYERGANRISASRLFQFSRVLDVPVSFFFDDMIEPGDRASADANFEEAADPLTKRETLELVRAYYRINRPEVRRKIFELAKALGSASSGAE